jgi:hypothetical protein
MNGISLQLPAGNGKPDVSAAPRRDVDARPAAPPAPEGLLAPFLGKRVEIRLTSGESITGTLDTLGKYEMVVVLTSGSPVIVFKNGAAWIGPVQL